MEPTIEEWPPLLPEYRFIPWQSLPESIKTQAENGLGYDEETWNYPGSNEAVESLSFSSLDDLKQDAAEAIGFLDEDTWDCWVNHFNDYDWFELGESDLSECFEVLGWTEESWESDDAPASETKDWSELTIEEQEGATCLCFFEDTWDGDLTLDQYSTIPLN